MRAKPGSERAINNKIQRLLASGASELIERPNLGGRSLRDNIYLSLRREGWKSRYNTGHYRTKLVNKLEAKIESFRSGDFNRATAQTLNAGKTKYQEKISSDEIEEGGVLGKELSEEKKRQTATRAGGVDFLRVPGWEWKSALETIIAIFPLAYIVSPYFPRMEASDVLKISPEINKIELEARGETGYTEAVFERDGDTDFWFVFEQVEQL